MQGAIISIGDELTLGQTVDTNSAYLSQQLVKRGIFPRYHVTVPDDRGQIARAITHAAQTVPVVLVTGGLGPTEDDLTREALADAMGVDLILDEASLQHISSFFARRNRPMPERNRTQAMHPRGAEAIPNSNGTAPGIKAKLHDTTIYVTPGVPRELYVMFEKTIGPELDKLAGERAILTTTLHTFGQGESDLAARLGHLMQRNRNPTVGTTVSNGYVSVRIRSDFPRKLAENELNQAVHAVKSALGAICFGRDDQTLPGAVVGLLVEKKLTMATAESCTGGLLGAMVTDVPGSSVVYVGGWVTYSNQMKASQLGVPPEVIEAHGAVSVETARAMAVSARERSGADAAVSITGIAGPDGGTAEKPVGTVYVGLALRDRARVFLLRLGGDRETIRDRAAKSALQLLRLLLMGEKTTGVTWAEEQ
ncbi:MAG: competence/damage-inducible protein A [Phycisphaera sp.]|nr:competence/damage-inducible protein A [Phycisphaera sp.]